MSDTMEPIGSGDEEHDREMMQFEADANAVNERLEPAVEAAKKIGLYADHAQVVPVQTPFGTKPGIAVMFQVGKVAFSDRIQDPEKDRIDDGMRLVEVGMAEDKFNDAKAQMAKNIAEGRDPLDDGDDDETVDPDDPFAGMEFDLDFSALAQNDDKDQTNGPS